MEASTYKISIDGKNIVEVTPSKEMSLSKIISTMTFGFKPIFCTFTAMDLANGETIKLLCRKEGKINSIPVWVGKNLITDDLSRKYNEFGNRISDFK